MIIVIFSLQKLIKESQILICSKIFLEPSLLSATLSKITSQGQEHQFLLKLTFFEMLVIVANCIQKIYRTSRLCLLQWKLLLRSTTNKLMIYVSSALLDHATTMCRRYYWMARRHSSSLSRLSESL